MARSWSAAAFLLAATLSAGTLEDLKSALKALPQGGTLRAAVEYQTWVRQGLAVSAEEASGQASLAVEDGPRGMKVEWSPGTLQQLEDEKWVRSVNGRAHSPAAQALRQFKAADLLEMLHPEKALLRDLEGAKVLEDRPDTLGGRPARLLALEVPLRLDEGERKAFRSLQNQLKVWIGADGLPLAAQHRLSFKATKYLLSFESVQELDWSLGRAGGRLVVLRHDESQSGSGVGLHNQARTVMVLKPEGK